MRGAIGLTLLGVLAMAAVNTLQAAEDHSMHQVHAAEPANAAMDSTSMSAMPEDSGHRSPHAYADGLTLSEGPYIPDGVSRLHLADEHLFSALAFDRLEAVDSDHGDHAVYDIQAWYGDSYRRLVLKAEGEVEAERLAESETEFLYSQALTPFWNLQAGLRHDSGEGPGRNWLAVGFAGLAPYWLEVDGALYLGPSGRSMLQLEAEYELLLTQRWVLQPRVELTAYGQDDEAVGVGSGLSSASAGLRLRYEISRQFAPYVGIEWRGDFGNTADLTGLQGGDTRATSLLAGVRFWF